MSDGVTQDDGTPQRWDDEEYFWAILFFTILFWILMNGIRLAARVLSEGGFLV